MTEDNPAISPIPGLYMGISPGDLIRVTRREIVRILRENDGNRLQALRAGLERFHTSGYITKRDLRRLERAANTVFAVEKGKRSQEEGLAELEDLYHEMVLDPETNQAASTIVGVTYARESGALISAFGLIGTVIGAGIGAALGGEDGWEEGMAWGAAIGAAVGGWIGSLCEE